MQHTRIQIFIINSEKKRKEKINIYLNLFSCISCFNNNYEEEEDDENNHLIVNFQFFLQQQQLIHLSNIINIFSFFCSLIFYRA